MAAKSATQFRKPLRSDQPYEHLTNGLLADRYQTFSGEMGRGMFLHVWVLRNILPPNFWLDGLYLLLHSSLSGP